MAATWLSYVSKTNLSPLLYSVKLLGSYLQNTIRVLYRIKSEFQITELQILHDLAPLTSVSSFLHTPTPGLYLQSFFMTQSSLNVPLDTWLFGPERPFQSPPLWLVGLTAGLTLSWNDRAIVIHPQLPLTPRSPWSSLYPNTHSSLIMLWCLVPLASEWYTEILKNKDCIIVFLPSPNPVTVHGT